MRLFLAILVITTIEVILIAKVGDAIGFTMTFLIIITTAMLGSWQLKKQWRLVIGKLQSLQSEPSQALLEALVLLICGVLLITPGFLTDIVGFIGLIPRVREQFVNIMRKNTNKFASYKFQTYSSSNKQKKSFEDDIIEGEFERKD